MSKDDLKTGGMLKSKEILILDSTIRRKKLKLDTLEKEARKVVNSVIRMHYCLMAITITTLFLHVGSVFYKDFPFVHLCCIMVSGILGFYLAMLIWDIHSARKRFSLLDESKK